MKRRTFLRLSQDLHDGMTTVRICTREFDPLLDPKRYAADLFRATQMVSRMKVSFWLRTLGLFISFFSVSKLFVVRRAFNELSGACARWRALCSCGQGLSHNSRILCGRGVPLTTEAISGPRNRPQTLFRNRIATLLTDAELSAA